MADSQQRRRVRIRGRVQGVGFRASTHGEATRLGAAGWVRNREDGSVEAVIEGTAAQVETLLAFCREGPRFAHVEAVEVTAEPPEGLREFGFR